jgi:hypothetical protein
VEVLSKEIITLEGLRKLKDTEKVEESTMEAITNYLFFKMDSVKKWKQRYLETKQELLEALKIVKQKDLLFLAPEELEEVEKL